MATALNEPDFLELCETAHQKGEALYRQAAFENEAHLPHKLGEGGDRSIELRGGLIIRIRNAKLRQILKLERQHEPVFPLTAKFYLSGSSRVQTKGSTDVKADCAEIAGCNYLYYLPNLTEVEEW